MTLAEGHLGAELLSAYLDREIDERERPPIEDHLEICLRCQNQLAGLRRVSEGLHRLERAAAPPVLQAIVQRHLVLEREGSGIASRWSSARRFRGGLSSQVFVMFALVFSLAVILYLFTSALERRSRHEPLLVPVFGAPGAPVAPEAHSGLTSEEIAVGARRFLSSADGYRQVGIVGAPVRTLATDSAEAAALLTAEPGLLPLLELGSLVLLLDGDPVEIVELPGGL